MNTRNNGRLSLKNNKLRIVWIIPNIFCYVMALGCTIFILLYAEELAEINRLVLYMLLTIAVYTVSIIGSYRIVSWIKEGKM
ncbi:hypothetical protein FZW96_11725 [Bacillus sp. BGMRC 2118]|nr:hypothetical protein FZW96_11725 [Bacillus sp. BGMRC 2118]